VLLSADKERSASRHRRTCGFSFCSKLEVEAIAHHLCSRSKPEVGRRNRDFRVASESRHQADIAGGPKSAPEHLHLIAVIGWERLSREPCLPNHRMIAAKTLRKLHSPEDIARM
jgi:hypothetical protein